MDISRRTKKGFKDRLLTYLLNKALSFRLFESFLFRGMIELIYIINLAVQSTLKSLKADAKEDPINYDFEQGRTHLLGCLEYDSTPADCLARLRQHIYVFKDIDAWRDVLKKQFESMEIQNVKLKLDMPVTGSSMHEILIIIIINYYAVATVWPCGTSMIYV